MTEQLPVRHERWKTLPPLSQKIYFLGLKYWDQNKEWPLALARLKNLKKKKLGKTVTTIDVLKAADEALGELARWGDRSKKYIEMDLDRTINHLRLAKDFGQDPGMVLALMAQRVVAWNIAFLSELNDKRGGPSANHSAAQCALELRELWKKETGKLLSWKDTGKFVFAICPSSRVCKNNSRVDFKGWIKHRVSEYRKMERSANDPKTAVALNTKKARRSGKRQNGLDPEQPAYDSFCRVLELVRKSKPTDAELAERLPFLKKLGGGNLQKAWKVVDSWNGQSSDSIWKDLSKEKKNFFDTGA